MIHGIIETILALAVAGLAALVCAMRRRVARDESEVYKTLTVDNHRLWVIYDTLRLYMGRAKSREERKACANLLSSLKRAFNGTEQ